MIKKEWLNESVWVDEFGRPYNLSDVPMTYMTREESYKKQRISKKDINKLWKEFKNDKTKKS
jgi:hypothetical protein|tara:strand:- start:339 stop:524 length:186 start_codon:yes stop_codon:yes gene_type:complete